MIIKFGLITCCQSTGLACSGPTSQDSPSLIYEDRVSYAMQFLLLMLLYWVLLFLSRWIIMIFVFFCHCYVVELINYLFYVILSVASEVADSFILPIFNCSPNFNTTNIKKYYWSRTDCYFAAAFFEDHRCFVDKDRNGYCVKDNECDSKECRPNSYNYIIIWCNIEHRTVIPCSSRIWFLLFPKSDALLKGCCHSAIPSIYCEIPHELGEKEQSSQSYGYSS